MRATDTIEIRDEPIQDATGMPLYEGHHASMSLPSPLTPVFGWIGVQDSILNRFTENARSVDDVDMELAVSLINERLSPVLETKV